ncbi:hypothetical protein HALDL1_08445 [Halobacterium sp. DL1]|jgi:hypothetical protein|nr:hypothetical protein HALDL1_08445 [Halobacterium sp. DL1]
MSPSRPFFDANGELDTAQLRAEAVPLAKLVLTVAVAALVPIPLRVLLLEIPAIFPWLTVLFSLATQFVLAVGTGLVLLYVVVRANRLSAEP